MSANEIHVGDVGTRITVTFQDGSSVVDISGASTKQIWLRRPAGSALKLDGTFTTDGSDGKIYIDSTASTFVTAGDTWEVQGYIETATGTWHSDKEVFEVFSNADRS
jgi:hypothetical protein